MSESLNVIALISGGKDSFFSLLHCIQQGHRIVALANLYPLHNAPQNQNAVSNRVQIVWPEDGQRETRYSNDMGGEAGSAADETDLNSFMYQTVGHEVIPLYAAATGLPLYRQPILGGAVTHERDYEFQALEPNSDYEETESMVPLLQTVMAHHPEANAVCAGAILSTYQRTRVESIALRLGLTPLAYLWNYPILPSPQESVDSAQLLKDMAMAGLDARIIKVASAGLGADHLWERVSNEGGAESVKRALRKFGTEGGAVLGEGGEFETLVVDGPSRLFKRRLVVPQEQRRPVQEGGGTTWLSIQKAWLEDKAATEDAQGGVREPDLFDTRFRGYISTLIVSEHNSGHRKVFPAAQSSILKRDSIAPGEEDDAFQWTFSGSKEASYESIEAETSHIVTQVRDALTSNGLTPSQITNTVVILRSMADFPKVNGEYGKLFQKPNPPSRVTISCGELLPQGRSILLHVTVTRAAARVERTGLHVQSRSYWAPANIGPYSQAVVSNVTLRGEPTGLKTVAVAGQIPLIPATMVLPAPSDDSLLQEIVLSLQHLWRIGVVMRVQLWTSGVALFSRSPSAEETARRAKLAGLAWNMAHAQVSEDEGDEGEEAGPDVWDLKYNAEYATLAAGDARGGETGGDLPDWTVFTLRQQNEPEGCVPPFFAIEVESLPRASTVEWHAHIGITGIVEGSAERLACGLEAAEGWQAWHTVVRAEDGNAAFVHTVISGNKEAVTRLGNKGGLEKRLEELYLGFLGEAFALKKGTETAVPYLTYVEKGCVLSTQADGVLPSGYLPCHSISSVDGEKYGCVALWKRTFQVTSK